MASASTPAPLLPVTNPVANGASAPTSGSVLPDASLATPASRLFMSRLSEMALRATRSQTRSHGRSCSTDRPSPGRTPCPTPQGGCAATSTTSASTTPPWSPPPSPPRSWPTPSLSSPSLASSVPGASSTSSVPRTSPSCSSDAPSPTVRRCSASSSRPCSPSSSRSWSPYSSSACSSGAPSLQRTAHSACQRTSSSTIRVLCPMATSPTSCSPSTRRLDLGFDGGR
jgi:hypothetical protein